LSPYQLNHGIVSLHSFLLVFLGIWGLIFGKIYIEYLIFPCYVLVPSSVKFLPLLLNFFVLFLLVLNASIFTFNNQFLNYYFSNIMFLSVVSIKLFSNYYFYFYNFVKSSEYGALNYILNAFPYNVTLKLSSILFSLSQTQPIKLVLYCLPFCVLIRFFVIF
jgi:hypothetical protein